MAQDSETIWSIYDAALPAIVLSCFLMMGAAAIIAGLLTKSLVQPVLKMTDDLDHIQENVPYKELIPFAESIHSDRMLRENNEKMRQEFTANVSHELKTPLTSISGYAELIETGIAKPEDTPGFARKIHVEASRMIQLVNDILQLSHLDNVSETGAAPAMETVDLLDVARECVERQKVNARHSYISLTYLGESAPVTGSRSLLDELCQNLCDNAIRYNRPGGKVQIITACTRDGHCTLTVKDNGIGMSKEYLPHIFEEFTREHSSTESHITGTGLGLPIVNSLVNLMGGTIDVESELGAGTITTICLTFELPTEEQLAAHQHKDEILEQSLQPLSENRVLLAEDNDLNAENVLTVLEENGIHAEHVKDGALCLKAVQNAPEDYFNVILMDIQLPYMNGYHAADAIRALPGKRGEIPIVAMTANAFEEDRRKALESGMNAHIAKPVDVSVLLETLSRFS